MCIVTCEAYIDCGSHNRGKLLASVLEHRPAAALRPSDVAVERSSPGRIVTVGNLKGGTGKSTISVNLACAMATRGRSVVIVDCDPQETSCKWLSRSGSPVATEKMAIDRISSAEAWLLRARALVAKHDVVIVDLPAVVTPALASAFLLSHVILVPVTPSAVDIDGTLRVLRYVRITREERPAAMPAVLLVPTRVDQTSSQDGILEDLLSPLHERVGPFVRERRNMAQAFREHRWIGEHAPESAAHADIMVLEAAVSELIDRVPDPPLLHRFPEPEQPPATPAARNGTIRPPIPWWRRFLLG